MLIPTHLRGCATKQDIEQSKNKQKLKLQCVKHGIEQFKIFYVGQPMSIKDELFIKVLENEDGFFFSVSIIFLGCKDSFLVLDKNLHGWNGWIYRDEVQVNKTKPDSKLWKCLNCGGIEHIGSLEIYSKGKEDFIREVEGKFDDDLWYDAFSWFKMNIECINCMLKTDCFIDYETM